MKVAYKGMQLLYLCKYAKLTTSGFGAALICPFKETTSVWSDSVDFTLTGCICPYDVKRDETGSAICYEYRIKEESKMTGKNFKVGDLARRHNKQVKIIAEDMYGNYICRFVEDDIKKGGHPNRCYIYSADDLQTVKLISKYEVALLDEDGLVINTVVIFSYPNEQYVEDLMSMHEAHRANINKYYEFE